MKNRAHHRQGHLLSTVSSWHVATVPFAVVLLLVQSFGVLYSQVRAATQAYGSGSSLELPVPLPTEPGVNPMAASGGQMHTVGGSLVSDEQRAAVLAEARAAQFHFRSDGEGAAQGANRHHRLDLSYVAGGMEMTPQRPDHLVLQPVPAKPEWRVRLAAQSLDYHGQTVSLDSGPPAPPEPAAERLSTDFGVGCTEWYVNREEGLEHGFTVENPEPGTEASGPLTVAIGVETGLRPVLAEGAVEFRNTHGNTVLLYRELHVFDHTGRELSSSMGLEDAVPGGETRITLTADTSGAVFPITIDPVIVLFLGPPIMAPSPATGERFGDGVAAFGNWMVSGASQRGNGMAFVHERNQGATGAWGLHSVLQFPATENPGTADGLGTSAAIGVHPETGQLFIALGAPDHAGCGAVLIFILVANAWQFLHKIQPNDLTGGDKFGCSLSFGGLFLAIGAYAHGFNGAAYVFSLAVVLGLWTLLQKITIASAGAGAQVGWAVAITAVNLLLGAPGAFSGVGRAFLLTLVAGVFAGVIQEIFTDKPGADGAPARFGWAVALTLTMIAIAAPGIDGFTGSILIDRGAVFLFALVAATWYFMTALFGAVAGGLFGHSIDMNHSNDLAVGRTGSVAGAVGGLVLLFLFSAFAFHDFANDPFNLTKGRKCYDPPDTISPPFSGGAIEFGHQVVLLGTLLFVAAVAYGAAMGVIFKFLLTATALSFVAWMSLSFAAGDVTNPALAHLFGPGGDYSGDGIPNIVKWGMGLLPFVYNASPLLALVANGYYQLVLPISLVALNALFVIQYSLGLALWFPLALGPLAGLFFTSHSELGITGNVMVVSLALAAAFLLFFRASVVET